MPYTAPELLNIGSAQNLVLGGTSFPDEACIIDNPAKPELLSHVDSLW
jgi:hypothetical protein